ncbi:Ion-translocating oxidoreductase complex subunit G [Vibrio stylophorae]|uniref:Ion-translocating oxidoreductase complex subunit G n=1 Tax=Vibrio stylophorae TaxID=659351 RepID=A0ABM8ZT26_9VIBR|nr:electron transport complex subunit RsxG [Vibrio stylophorae]CAH0533064.1 Ion-translocating oxidoreductase complex subunit G [Vibrio stylophorae]
MIRAMSKNGLLLGLFALASTAVVSLTYLLTKDAISVQQEKQLLKVLSQIVPASSHDNNLYQSCTLASDSSLGKQPMPVYRALKAGQANGAALEVVAPDGYNGDIHIVVALDNAAKITGVRILGHNETPGLGDKIDLKVSNWVLSFDGMTVVGEADSRWAVRKDGGQFDQFTGATITPRAVVGAVKRAVIYYQKHQAEIATWPNNCHQGDAHE